MAKATRSARRSPRSARSTPRGAASSRKVPARKGAARSGRRRTGRRSGSDGVTEGVANTGNTLGGMPIRTLTPHLVVEPAAEAIEWYAKVLGAKELNRVPLPNGRIMHAVLRVGDTAFMLADPFGPAPKEMAGAYVHVQDKGIERMWQRAVENGATVVLPLANQFWGDRYGQLRDPFGQLWSFGWPAKMGEAERQRLQQEAMRQMAQAP